MTAHGKDERRSAWKGGVATGLIGGAGMAIFMMNMNAAKGMDVLTGANVVLPIIGLGQIPTSMPVGQAIFEHVLFGIATAVAFLPFQRRTETRWPTVQPT